MIAKKRYISVTLSIVEAIVDHVSKIQGVQDIYKHSVSSADNRLPRRAASSASSSRGHSRNCQCTSDEAELFIIEKFHLAPIVKVGVFCGN